MVEFISKGTIKLDRILSDLDKFVLGFIRILEKHTDYVIVGGYTAILFGRTRGTEDIDLIVPFMDKAKFADLLKTLEKKGYWFINSDDTTELYDLLRAKHGIRIAIKNELTPNIELKFSKDEVDEDALKKKITVLTSSGKLIIGYLELQIAYKEQVLGSEKDLEDARHLRKVFEKEIDSNLIEKLKRRLK